MEYFSIALAVALTGVAAAIGESYIGKTAMEGLARQPELESKIRMLMLIGMAFVETAVLFGLVVAILLCSKLS